MMRGLAVAIGFMILLPSVGFSQDLENIEVCSHTGAPAYEGNLDSDAIDALTRYLQRAGPVVVCMDRPPVESEGHGIFGLVTWEKREIAALQLERTNDNSYVITNIVRFTALKAPLGVWHADENSLAPVRAARVATDLEQDLTRISRELLGPNDPEDVTILWSAR